jgi:branched-chain amino acid transport system substrate-binding protein
VPTREQATTYATVKHYLKTIQATKTDDAATVVKAMKASPMDLFGQTGPIRADGRFIYDLTLYQVKTPAESGGPWDYYKPVRAIAGKDAFVPAEKSECALMKTSN